MEDFFQARHFLQLKCQKAMDIYPLVKVPAYKSRKARPQIRTLGGKKSDFSLEHCSLLSISKSRQQATEKRSWTFHTIGTVKY